VDLVLPTAAALEKDGSLTNIGGRIQNLRKVLEPAGESLAEWEVLSRIGLELGLEGDIFEARPAIGKTRRALDSEMPFFKGGG